MLALAEPYRSAISLRYLSELDYDDIAQRQGLRIDLERLSAELGVPVVPTTATRRRGIDELVAANADDFVLYRTVRERYRPAEPSDAPAVEPVAIATPRRPAGRRALAAS